MNSTGIFTIRSRPQESIIDQIVNQILNEFPSSDTEVWLHLLTALTHLLSLEDPDDGILKEDYFPCGAYSRMCRLLAEDPRWHERLTIAFDDRLSMELPLPDWLSQPRCEELLLARYASARVVNQAVLRGFEHSNFHVTQMRETFAPLNLSKEVQDCFLQTPEKTGMRWLSQEYHDLYQAGLDEETESPSRISLFEFEQRAKTRQQDLGLEKLQFGGIDIGGSQIKLLLLEVREGRTSYVLSDPGHWLELRPWSEILSEPTLEVREFATRLMGLWLAAFGKRLAPANLLALGCGWPGAVTPMGKIACISRTLARFSGQTIDLADASLESLQQANLQEELREAWNSCQFPSGNVYLLNDGQAAAWGAAMRMLDLTDPPPDEKLYHYSLGAHGAAIAAACSSLGE